VNKICKKLHLRKLKQGHRNPVCQGHSGDSLVLWHLIFVGLVLSHPRILENFCAHGLINLASILYSCAPSYSCFIYWVSSASPLSFFPQEPVEILMVFVSSVFPEF
jgi:hypothetical protein